MNGYCVRFLALCAVTYFLDCLLYDIVGEYD